jgi:hypothetical protein
VVQGIAETNGSVVQGIAETNGSVVQGIAETNGSVCSVFERVLNLGADWWALQERETVQ